MCEREPERNRSIRQLLGAVGRAAARARECLDALSRVPPGDIDAILVATVIYADHCMLRAEGMGGRLIVPALLMRKLGYNGSGKDPLKRHKEVSEIILATLNMLTFVEALEKVESGEGTSYYQVHNPELLARFSLTV
ncbi:hypothetical protein FJZ40_03220 [Candidatus Shapirobacteria bacterium]|nr:hypothetical protein [Candidatus Shapirobacteria bacterium]